jgi:hypothetical protein
MMAETSRRNMCLYIIRSMVSTATFRVFPTGLRFHEIPSKTRSQKDITGCPEMSLSGDPAPSSSSMK